MNYFRLICILSLSLFLCCKTKNKTTQGEHVKTLTTGVLTNLTGLDACGWVITLDQKLADGTSRLEPDNLKDFNINLVEGQPVEFSYELVNGASACMVGKRALLTTLKNK